MFRDLERAISTLNGELKKAGHPYSVFMGEHPKKETTIKMEEIADELLNKDFFERLADFQGANFKFITHLAQLHKSGLTPPESYSKEAKKCHRRNYRQKKSGLFSCFKKKSRF